MPLTLHDTMSRKAMPFTPGNPAHVTFYTCGPTVYDDQHVGNFRAFLLADVLRRFIESPLCSVTNADGSVHAGPRRVTHVMNITDVGHLTDDTAADCSGADKMVVAGERLKEAKKCGELPESAEGIDPCDPVAIAGFFTDRFLDDATALGLKVAIESDDDPSLMPHATGAIDGMIELVQRLIDKGHAYAVGEPGAQVVYFDVSTFPAYGALSGNTQDALREGAGGRISECDQSQKRSPADFMLWKSDPTHLMRWASPWGEGYPGWHLECSHMALGRLGDTSGMIDLHSGGEDNIFPHHECEIAQSCCATGADKFSRHWFHVRYLQVEGEKMSKSKGNFFTPRQLIDDGVAPGAIRFEIIKTHYRANANFTEQGLRDASRTVDRWRAFRDEAKSSGRAGAPRERFVGMFADALHDDLNTARAIGVVNEMIKDAGGEPTLGDAEAMDLFDAVLGVLELAEAETEETEIGVFIGGLDRDESVNALLAERRDARANKDYARADAIRDELASRGLAIKDLPEGRVEVRPA